MLSEAAGNANTHELASLRRASLGWTAVGGCPHAILKLSRANLLPLLFAAAHLQVGANEWLQVPVDHGVHVPDFHLGAVIFD
jgi:hypothetical protein